MGRESAGGRSKILWSKCWCYCGWCCGCWCVYCLIDSPWDHSLSRLWFRGVDGNCSSCFYWSSAHPSMEGSQGRTYPSVILVLCSPFSTQEEDAWPITKMHPTTGAMISASLISPIDIVPPFLSPFYGQEQICTEGEEGKEEAGPQPLTSSLIQSGPQIRGYSQCRRGCAWKVLTTWLAQGPRHGHWREG